MPYGPFCYPCHDTLVLAFNHPELRVNKPISRTKTVQISNTPSPKNLRHVCSEMQSSCINVVLVIPFPPHQGSFCFNQTKPSLPAILPTGHRPVRIPIRVRTFLLSKSSSSFYSLLDITTLKFDNQLCWNTYGLLNSIIIHIWS